MLHVAVISEFPTLSGGERSLLAAVDAMPPGVRYSVVVPPGPLAEAWSARGAGVVAWSRRRDGEAVPLDAARAEVAEHLKRLRADVIHANSLSMGRLVGPVARDAGIPSIAHLRDIVRPSAKAVADLSANTRLLAVSWATANFHMAAGVPAERMHVLYNGVNLEEFRPRPATGYLHAELGLAPGAPQVISIGQIILRKGWDDLLGVAHALLARGVDAHFVLVGACHSEKPETQELHRVLRHAEEHQLRGRLHLLGERDDVARLLCEAAVVFHAARQEPLGRVLLEAAACGRAIVASDAGGTREIFPPGSNAAAIMPTGDLGAFTDALVWLLGDAGLREAFGRAARREVEARFDARDCGRGLLRHYQEVREGVSNTNTAD